VEKLEKETTKIARRIANVDLGLLALSKRVVNRTFDLMGFTTSIQYGGEFDSLGHFLKTGFNELRREKGLKALCSPQMDFSLFQTQSS